MNEDIKFLKELQKELREQSNDGQASPRFWVLKDYRWERAEEGCHDRVTIYSPNDSRASDLDDYVHDILNGESDTQYEKEQIEELRGKTCEEEILEWVQENDDEDCYFIYEVEQDFIVPNTMFLTKEEALSHIKLNNYHYTDKVHTYAMTAWRAPKVEKLLKILETTNWDSYQNSLEGHQRKTQ